jgi:ABC-type amino acid transport substrate-binding protein
VIEKSNPKPFSKIFPKFLIGLIFVITLFVVASPSEVFSTATSASNPKPLIKVGIQSDHNEKFELAAGVENNNIKLDLNAINSKTLLTEDIEMYPPDIKRIIERGYLEVAMKSIDSPPFFQVDSSEHPCKGDPNKFVNYEDKIFCGLDVSLSKGIADELGVDVHFIRSAHTFNETVDLVFENKADIAISKISRTLSRAKKVSFSQPYLTMKQSLLLNRVQFAEQSSGRRPEIAIRELTGNIGVIEGSSYVGNTNQKFPKTVVREQPSWSDVLEAARNGEIVAAYRDELEVKRAILQDPSEAINFQTVVLTDTNDFVAIVLPWQSLHLREYVDDYLSANNIDFTADSLLDQFRDLLLDT